jgi:hypothetical protein
MMQWGNEWTLTAPSVDLLHKPCGYRVGARVVCSHCGQDIDARDTEPVVGRGCIERRSPKVEWTGARYADNPSVQVRTWIDASPRRV